MIIKAMAQWSWLVVARVVGIITGLVMVPIALPFKVREQSKSDGRPILNLPKWAWLWGNDFDGLLGDKRLWWKDNTPFGWDYTGYKAMFWWAAIRNPANNMRLLDAFSAPIKGSVIDYKGNYVVEDKPGLDGWQLVRASQEGKEWYGFYFVHCWSATRAFVIRVGFKIKPEHQGKDEPRKGLTFKVNPYKSI